RAASVARRRGARAVAHRQRVCGALPRVDRALADARRVGLVTFLRLHPETCSRKSSHWAQVSSPTSPWERAASVSKGGCACPPGLDIAYFGASTGAAAALVAAAQRPANVRAVVSRGGRPDLAGEWLSRVIVPVLLLVGENDREVIALNRQAQAALPASELSIV